MTPPPATNPNFVTTNTSIGAGSIEINLCENDVVCGFGELIPVSDAKNMITDYFGDFDDIEGFINLLKSTSGVPDIIKSHRGFAVLSGLFDENNHTVSGVFGKEVLLQILGQKKCEGIRYFIGKHDGKPTVIMAGVKNEEVMISDEQNLMQVNAGVSEMLPDAKAFLNIRNREDERKNPMTIEVHGLSKTVKEVREMIVPEHLKDIDFADDFTTADKVFLSF